jgi:hypothetical protein
VYRALMICSYVRLHDPARNTMYMPFVFIVYIEIERPLVKKYKDDQRGHLKRRETQELASSKNHQLVQQRCTPLLVEFVD